MLVVAALLATCAPFRAPIAPPLAMPAPPQGTYPGAIGIDVLQPRLSMFARCIHSADFNHDGHPDLAVSGINPQNLALLLSSGIAYPNTVFYSMGNADLSTFALGDLDHDGNPDVVAPDTSVPNVGIRRGNAIGQLGSLVSYPTAGAAGTVLLADFDQDGNLDLAVSIPSAIAVEIRLGDGLGGLGNAAMFPAGDLASAIASADLDHDGDPDLIVPSATGLEILLGDGAGGFAAPSHQAFAARANAVATADLDQDGNVDIVATVPFDLTYGTVVLLFGDGFGGIASVATTASGFKSSTPTIADIDLDGLLDLLIPNEGSDDLWLYHGAAAGGVGPATEFVTAQVPTGLVVDDLSGDGLPDAATCHSSYFSQYINILVGRGPGDFRAPRGVLTDGDLGGFLVTVALGDLNKDGNVDAAAVSAGNSATVILQDGAEKLLDGTAYPFPFSNSALSLAIADMSGDGNPDLIAGVSSGGPKVHVTLGDGAGHFGPFATGVPGPYGGVDSLAIRDVNGDGKPDVVFVNQPGSLGVGIGNGSGGFSSSATYPIPGQPQMHDLGDMDGDGLLDAVCTNATYPIGSITIQKGDGLGHFGAPAAFAIPPPTFACRLADVDEDGDLDVVTAANASPNGTILVLLGNGAGSLGAPMTTPVPFMIQQLAARDIDGDGHVDVLAVDNDGFLDLHRGDGAGSFALEGRYFAGTSFVLSLAVGDLDADGRLDALVGRSSGLSIFPNLGNPPAGSGAYGTGTPGSLGRIGLAAASAPKVNNPNFAILSTNVRRDSLGLVVLTDSQDAGGSFAFGFPLLVHVDFALAGEILAFDAVSDHAGGSRCAAPIPNFPWLAGKQYFAQTIWLEDAASGENASASTFHLLSSVGLALTIAP